MQFYNEQFAEVFLGHCYQRDLLLHYRCVITQLGATEFTYLVISMKLFECVCVIVVAYTGCHIGT